MATTAFPLVDFPFFVGVTGEAFVGATALAARPRFTGLGDLAGEAEAALLATTVFLPPLPRDFWTGAGLTGVTISAATR